MTSSNNPIFQGVATALITPFKDQKLDITAYKKLLQQQILSGINALVLCGTTGESATLTEKECATLLATAQDEIGTQLPLIMGCGGNDTATVLKKSREAAAHGADALLIVTPYYNKGTKRGIIHHYLSVAESVDVPIILYNVPSRTGVDLSLDMIEELAMHPNIVAIKEASGNIDRIAQIIQKSDKNFSLYSGNDSQILPILSLGGKGVISVVSNILPSQTSQLCRSFFEGDIKNACRLQLKLLPLIQLLFTETNPAPIKAAMSIAGISQNELRLPMATIEAPLFENIKEKLLPLLQDE